MPSSLGTTAPPDPGQPHIIRLELHDMRQLFNSMDPSPFIERDLDDDAEEFIVSWAQEFPLPGDTGATVGVLRESLTIAGWVAMWRPMQIYLYDWWPLRQTGQIYGKLSRMPVEVIRHEKA